MHSGAATLEERAAVHACASGPPVPGQAATPAASCLTSLVGGRGPRVVCIRERLRPVISVTVHHDRDSRKAAFTAGHGLGGGTSKPDWAIARKSRLCQRMAIPSEQLLQDRAARAAWHAKELFLTWCTSVSMGEAGPAGYRNWPFPLNAFPGPDTKFPKDMRLSPDMSWFRRL